MVRISIFAAKSQASWHASRPSQRAHELTHASAGILCATGIWPYVPMRVTPAYLETANGRRRNTRRGPMLKHTLVVATLAFATLTFSENGVRAATLPPADLAHPTTTALVRF